MPLLASVLFSLNYVWTNLKLIILNWKKFQATYAVLWPFKL